MQPKLESFIYTLKYYFSIFISWQCSRFYFDQLSPFRHTGTLKEENVGIFLSIFKKPQQFNIWFVSKITYNITIVILRNIMESWIAECMKTLDPSPIDMLIGLGEQFGSLGCLSHCLMTGTHTKVTNPSLICLRFKYRVSFLVESIRYWIYMFYGII